MMHNTSTSTSHDKFIREFANVNYLRWRALKWVLVLSALCFGSVKGVSEIEKVRISKEVVEVEANLSKKSAEIESNLSEAKDVKRKALLLLSEADETKRILNEELSKINILKAELDSKRKYSVKLEKDVLFLKGKREEGQAIIKRKSEEIHSLKSQLSEEINSLQSQLRVMKYHAERQKIYIKGLHDRANRQKNDKGYFWDALEEVIVINSTGKFCRLARYGERAESYIYPLSDKSKKYAAICW